MKEVIDVSVLVIVQIACWGWKPPGTPAKRPAKTDMILSAVLEETRMVLALFQPSG